MAKKAESEAIPAEVFAVFIEGLVGNHTISADVAGIIKHAIAANGDKLNAGCRAKASEGE